MLDLSATLRYLTLFLLALWRIYWHWTELHAERIKPKQKERLPLFHKKNLSKVVTLGAFIPVVLQLLGFVFLPFPDKYLWVELLGFSLVVIGLGIAVVGRYNLGTNWARSYDYQVKDKQKLVTTGIYRFIRHPIYSGLMLMFIGVTLMVQSYVVFLYMLMCYGVYLQAKWEEVLLIKHFGEGYKTYMKKTTRFIPFIW